MAFTENNYSASMQDVFALRLEMMNQVKMLQEKIAEGGGDEPFIIEITYDDVNNKYNTTVTAAEFWAAWNAGKLIQWHMYSPAYGGFNEYNMWGYPQLIYDYYDDVESTYHYWAAVIEWMRGNRLYAQNSTDYLTSDDHWSS